MPYLVFKDAENYCYSEAATEEEAAAEAAAFGFKDWERIERLSEDDASRYRGDRGRSSAEYEIRLTIRGESEAVVRETAKDLASTYAADVDVYVVERGRTFADTDKKTLLVTEEPRR